jgi:hypothetical protein
MFAANVAIAVAVSILLWKDATPRAGFPPIRDVVTIELGRVLGHPAVMREHPWLRSRLAPIQRHLASEPWDVDAPRLLSEYEALLDATERDAVGVSIRDTSYVDPTFDMIRRHGTPPRATAESILVTARKVAAALEITDDVRKIEDGTRDRYVGIYSQLRHTSRAK